MCMLAASAFSQLVSLKVFTSKALQVYSFKAEDSSTIHLCIQDAMISICHV